MKINDERIVGCSFGSLSYGTCFIYDGDVFMVIHPASYDQSNAIFLETGETSFFDEDEYVIPVEAELTIK